MIMRVGVEERLRVAFTKAIDSTLSDHEVTATTDTENVAVTPTRPNVDADYQCNDAFRLAKIVKRSPRDIAESICENVRRDDDENMFKSVQVSGAGFVNVRLRSSWIRRSAAAVAGTVDPEKGISLPSTNPRRVLVDFASPNMSKELHVGHLRSSIIGDTLCRVLSSRGHDVSRVSHVGDWGPPMAMVIEELRDASHVALLQSTRNIIADSTVLPSASYLGDAYVRAKSKMESNESGFQDRVSETLQELQSSEEMDRERVGSARHAWWLICESSRRACADIFDRLDISVEERGESTYQPFVEDMLADLTSRDMLDTIEDGALIARCGGNDDDDDTETTSVVVRKSNGTSLYATMDLVALRERLRDGLSRVVYVTDHSQSSHFEAVFTLARAAGWFSSDDQDAVHCSCGLVKGSDNRKLSSRKGDAPSLRLLLDELYESAHEHVVARRQHDSHDNDEDLAEVLMRGAVRYWELSHHRKSDYAFDAKKMFDENGNTSVALIYVCARIRSVRERAEEKWPSLTDTFDVLHTVNAVTTHERELYLTMAQYPDVVRFVSKELTPHHLCEFLHKLSSQFHRFYSNDRILGDPNERSRLALCAGVDSVMRSGLTLLGVPVPRQRL